MPSSERDIRFSCAQYRAAAIDLAIHNDARMSDKEFRALKVSPHKVPGDNLGHDHLGIVHALAALLAQHVGKCTGQVGEVGGKSSIGPA